MKEEKEKEGEAMERRKVRDGGRGQEEKRKERWEMKGRREGERRRGRDG